MIFDLDNKKSDGTIIKVLGVGGGGSNAVSHMYKQNIVGVSFAICNTDAQALELSSVPTKIHLGPMVTGGRGAGNKPESGRQAGEESEDEIRNYLSDGCQMLFVTAGMGGGTGTGAAPIIARIARDMGILTVGIVTLPFTFEGKRRIRNGVKGLIELRKQVDALVVISNDKLNVIHSDMPFRQAFAQADNVLSTAARGIAEIITVGGYVNVDFEDVNTVLRDSGVAIMGTGYAEGEDRAKAAVDHALSSPLLEDNDIRGAQNILLNISSGSKEVTMNELDQITQFVQDEAGHDADLIWGQCYNESLEDGLSVTVIATGFEDSAIQAISGSERPTREVVDLKQTSGSRRQVESYTPTNAAEPDSNEYEFKNIHPRLDKYNENLEYRNKVMREMKQGAQARDQETQRPTDPAPTYRRDFSRGRTPTPPSSSEDLAKLEREPAYLRRRANRADRQESQQPPRQQPSRTVINKDGEPRLGDENPWIYDKAD